MTNRTVEFYENKITETAKATINRNIAIFSRLNIPLEEFRSSSSLTSLSERYAIPIETYNVLIIGGINALMHEYLYNGTGIPPRSIFGRMFASNRNCQDQTEIAHKTTLACDRILFNLLHNQPMQECINDIKSLLETGLLANNLHPQDNFPKIVKAIANQTAGMHEWEFSPDAVEHLNQVESNHRLDR